MFETHSQRERERENMENRTSFIIMSKKGKKKEKIISTSDGREKGRRL